MMESISHLAEYWTDAATKHVLIEIDLVQEYQFGIVKQTE